MQEENTYYWILCLFSGVQRNLPLSGEFFPSRWKTSVANNEVIVNINIPFSKKVSSAILNTDYIGVFENVFRNPNDVETIRAKHWKCNDIKSL